MRQRALVCALLALLALVALSGCARPYAPSPSSLPTQSPSSVAREPSDTPRPTETPLPIISAEPFETGEATCVNEAEGYAVSYPADWTVAPPDPEREFPVRACAYFGPGLFEVDPLGGDGGQPWTIDIGVFSGGCLEFDLIDLPTELKDVIVAGYPATRAEMSRGGYGYILNLRGDDGSSLVEPNDPTPPSSDECHGAHGLMIAGRDWGAVKGLPLRRIVDRMASSIEILGE